MFSTVCRRNRPAGYVCTEWEKIAAVRCCITALMLDNLDAARATCWFTAFMEDVSIAFLLTVVLEADASAKLFINVSIVSPLPVELLIHVRQAGLEAGLKSQEKDLSVGCNTGEF